MVKATILVVEDNPNVRKMLRLTLTTAGYQVLEAETGGEALDIVKKKVPRLILQDLVLPDMHGIELNQRLRKVIPENLPIIALSGFLNRIEEKSASTAGFTTLLLKPIEPSHLIEVIHSYLPPARKKASVHMGKKVLLVDDDPVQLKLLALHLTHAGFEVTTAVDGSDAYSKAIQILPDAILSDILMPHVDGFELCLQIRQNKDLSDTPVILLSSQYLEKSDQALAKKVGANDFVVRSYDSKKLIEILIKNLQAKTPRVSAVPPELFKEEHIHSLIRQLERQIVTSSGLVRRSSLQGAQLSLLKEVADSINTKEDIDTILQNILAITLDSAGISRGILYLKEPKSDTLTLKKYIGYQNIINMDLFFGHPELFKQAMQENEVIQIPSSKVSETTASRFLKSADVDNALLVPLISLSEPLGVLYLGSNSAEMMTSDSISFARALGSQIGQTIALVQTFDAVAISEKRYRTLMSSASCGIFTCDLNGIILEINDEVEKLFGSSKEDIVGQPYTAFTVTTDRAYATSLIPKVLRENSLGPQEGRVLQQNGNIRDIEFTVTKVEIKEEIVLLVIVNDITERNRLRAQILLSDRLATVGTLAAGIVHEINNPATWTLENLLAMKDYDQEMQELFVKVESSSTDEDKSRFLELLKTYKQRQSQYRDMIEESIQGASHIQEIVRNLKGFARIDSDVQPNPINIHDVINSAVKMAYPEFKYHGRVEKAFDEKIPALLINSGKLHQVCLNLLINASQAIAESKRKDNIIKITTSLEKDFVRIDITDTGVGIPPDLLPRLFEPFFTTKPSGVGTGLGLPIVREILNNMNAEIEVTSKVGEGSTFTVRLPIQLARQVKPSTPKKYKARSEHLKVLIIDDEPSLLKTMQRMLEMQHQVTTVLGGQAALKLLSKKANSFDIIVTDLNMPEVNGEEIYYYLSTNFPGVEQRMVFVTGDVTLNSPAQQFLREIPNGSIRKPFTREELLRTIDTVTEAALHHK